MKKLVVILSMVSICLMAAKSSIKSELLGVWKIQSMEIKGMKMQHQQMGLPYIEFNEEGGFMIKVGSGGEKGRFIVKGNDVTLKFLMPKKPSQLLHITRIDDKQLDYTTTDSTGEVKVSCYRITQGLSGEKD